MSIGPWLFNGFDIAVIVVCLISLVMALRNGFAKELIAILALVVGIIATLFVWGQYRPAMREFIKDPEWLADGVLGIGTFFLVYFVIGFLLRNIAGAGGSPSFSNRLLGGAFGIARGLFVVAIATLIWNSNYRDKAELAEQYGAPNPVKSEMFNSSTIYPIIERIEGFLLALPLPEIKSAAKSLADGDTEGAVDKIEDVVDGNE